MDEVLKLPAVTITHKDGEITITHTAGMQTTISADRLALWAIGVLRKDLTIKPQEAK